MPRRLLTDDVLEVRSGNRWLVLCREGVVSVRVLNAETREAGSLRPRWFVAVDDMCVAERLIDEPHALRVAMAIIGWLRVRPGGRLDVDRLVEQTADGGDFFSFPVNLEELEARGDA